MQEQEKESEEKAEEEEFTRSHVWSHKEISEASTNRNGQNNKFRTAHFPKGSTSSSRS